MIEIIRTDSGNQHFRQLTVELDKELAIKNGEMNDFFVQFNKIDEIKNAVLAIERGRPVGCGGMKVYADRIIEIKRMYVEPNGRGNGVASAILGELEQWARELGYHKCILETGKNMPEAIGLYQKHGYHVISNYGQYEHVESSICFGKNM